LITFVPNPCTCIYFCADLIQITHVFYGAYTGHGSSFQELKKANMNILANTLDAVEAACPKFKFFSFQTGGKLYGVEFADKLTLKAPFKESHPRIPEPYANDIFYYSQQDLLAERSKDKSWTWSEAIPDGIIGFQPTTNGMNLGRAIGLFLAMFKSLEGEGATVPFPGDEKSWTTKHGDTSADLLADFHIYAALNPERVREQRFNICNGDVVSWEQEWPKLCAYFGLKGVGPDASKLSGTAWVEANKDKWADWIKSNGLHEGTLDAVSWGMMDGMLGGAQFDRQFDLIASRKAGFTQTVDSASAYFVAWDKMKATNMLPEA
jgi:nucleoside-diphosphate-sugar epimerase